MWTVVVDKDSEKKYPDCFILSTIPDSPNHVPFIELSSKTRLYWQPAWLPKKYPPYIFEDYQQACVVAQEMKGTPSHKYKSVRTV